MLLERTNFFFNFRRCFCCCVVFVVHAAAVVAVLICDIAKCVICVNLISNANPYWQGI